MSISKFILALYVFLQAGSGLDWFDADPKLVAIVGIAFVICVIVEEFLDRSGNMPRLFRKKEA